MTIVYEKLYSERIAPKATQKEAGTVAKKLEAKHIEAMFQLWRQTKSLTEVASRFHHARSTIRRHHKNGKWQLRADEIQQKADEKLSEKIANATISDYQVTTDLLEQVVKILEDDQSGVKASFSDAIRLLAVRAELTGGSSGRTGGVNLFQVMADGTLDTLTESELGQRLSSHGAFVRRRERLRQRESSLQKT